jgi:hypothetical protein
VNISKRHKKRLIIELRTITSSYECHATLCTNTLHSSVYMT